MTLPLANVLEAAQELGVTKGMVRSFCKQGYLDLGEPLHNRYFLIKKDQNYNDLKEYYRLKRKIFGGK